MCECKKLTDTYSALEVWAVSLEEDPLMEHSFEVVDLLRDGDVEKFRWKISKLQNLFEW